MIFGGIGIYTFLPRKISVRNTFKLATMWNIYSMAATDERNFRSLYYEKVGFRNVEEKKSLEILLKDKPLDRGKLKQFCLRFSVPATYRNLVWKILLGVIPVHVDCHEFIMDQREQEYNDLLRALNVMRIIDQNTPKTQVFLAMWLLQTDNLTYDLNLSAEHGFLPIVQSFMQFFDNSSDVYWMAKKFYDNVRKFQADVPILVERTHILLEKEDSAYYKSLVRNGILDNLPLNKWFDCCFAGILNDSALAKYLKSWRIFQGSKYVLISGYGTKYAEVQIKYWCMLLLYWSQT
ncbi:unnamed protein product [Acanthoscelides obtectus]|uniref:TBC1 domain family member 7 n=1 Tax=Acanthoscelides obtectus TaxID=200917 RepID=A0A9P0PC57_ACAOB|nr:unnamed protein product [Acanthoscelides obtectus]CAK1682965.1 TBC1 domain family member 7 [Acanthoscelides obtectus]